MMVGICLVDDIRVIIFVEIEISDDNKHWSLRHDY